MCSHTVTLCPIRMNSCDLHDDSVHPQHNCVALKMTLWASKSLSVSFIMTWCVHNDSVWSLQWFVMILCAPTVTLHDLTETICDLHNDLFTFIMTVYDIHNGSVTFTFKWSSVMFTMTYCDAFDDPMCSHNGLCSLIWVSVYTQWLWVTLPIRLNALKFTLCSLHNVSLWFS